ncbi:MAG TPA: YbjN domain-containing protein [Acidimicrobiales bacterium]|nr:YbjN domain-containing protein [Acidimicrobiales bacterium]
MSAHDEASRLAELRAWLAAKGIESDDDGDRVMFAFTGENGTYPGVLLARESQDEVVMYSVAPLAFPAELRTAAALFLTRVNYGLAQGNFELDLDDGEVRYKTIAALHGADIDDTVMGPLVLVNLSTMDRYVPALFELLTGADPHETARAAG